MPAKTEVISTAAKDTDLEKAYNSALKALSVLGVKMTTKKPDPVKLGPLMASTKKKAEFCLSVDGNKLSLIVRVDKNKNTLGLVDLSVEKNLERRIALMKALVDAGLATKAEVTELEKELKKMRGPDPKVVANTKRLIQDKTKLIAEKEKLAENYKKVDVAAAFKAPKVWADLCAFAKSEHNDENLEFLNAIAKKADPNSIYKEFIGKEAKREVNLPASIVAALKEAADKKQKLNFGPAVEEIQGLVDGDTIPRYRSARTSAIKTEIAKLRAEIETLEKELSKLVDA